MCRRSSAAGPYEFFAEEYRKPVVIAGFEPLDVMQAILMLVRQINDGRAEVENEFTRAVTREGNLKAQALVSEVFELRRSFEWRGLGEVPYSALRIREAFAALRRRAALRARDAIGRRQQGLRVRRDPARREAADATARSSARVCTPENPIGSCMVSSEGACAAHYSYGRFKDATIVVASNAGCDGWPGLVANQLAAGIVRQNRQHPTGLCGRHLLPAVPGRPMESSR